MDAHRRAWGTGRLRRSDCGHSEPTRVAAPGGLPSPGPPGFRLDSAAVSAILRYMPKYLALDRMFHALADSSRRAMVERLSRGPASVSELARPFEMALPTVVQHLGVLEEAGIVTSAKVGRVRTYQLAPDALVPVNTWIVARRRPQEAQLDRLGDYLTRQPKTTNKKGRQR